VSDLDALSAVRRSVFNLNMDICNLENKWTPNGAAMTSEEVSKLRESALDHARQLGELYVKVLSEERRKAESLLPPLQAGDVVVFKEDFFDCKRGDIAVVKNVRSEESCYCASSVVLELECGELVVTPSKISKCNCGVSVVRKMWDSKMFIWKSIHDQYGITPNL